MPYTSSRKRGNTPYREVYMGRKIWNTRGIA
jgi:hypothetical protein